MPFVPHQSRVQQCGMQRDPSMIPTQPLPDDRQNRGVGRAGPSPLLPLDIARGMHPAGCSVLLSAAAVALRVREHTLYRPRLKRDRQQARWLAHPDVGLLYADAVGYRLTALGRKVVVAIQDDWLIQRLNSTSPGGDLNSRRVSQPRI